MQYRNPVGVRTIVEHVPQMRVAFLARLSQSAPCPGCCRRSPAHFHAAIGAQKLGQPVPESNFVVELNSALSQQMQR